MNVCIATKDDIDNWLEFASEVSTLFGCDLANDTGYRTALIKNIERGTAFCVKESDTASNSRIIGAFLFSPKKKPIYEISWFAVSEKWRRQGIGQLLVNYAVSSVMSPAEIMVKTFIEGCEVGTPARKFYESMGLLPCEIIEGEGPYGSDIQVYRKNLP